MIDLVLEDDGREASDSITTRCDPVGMQMDVVVFQMRFRLFDPAEFIEIGIFDHDLLTSKHLFSPFGHGKTALYSISF